MIIADQHGKHPLKPGDRRDEKKNRAPTEDGHSRSANPQQDDKAGERERKPEGRDAHYEPSK
ncbi:hypothetical protein KHC23_00990 [Ancylobacter dichloromethanicus]|uniref:Uncharacterized protein n=1 Tax=Ancylobacter dichloromethanicus TaxID=518825 RepID=A0A9W6JDS5_9HYPH|nr:hypothetical protein [Ancylobacter dichloromethanicus]MBS7552234.1 hypothetical protein [Ancylobacter dichloromethanicus]GLK73970.1 hypothetical protein GCM10017643_40880 [Ancylobacter dichloromethanicus]